MPETVEAGVGEDTIGADGMESLPGTMVDPSHMVRCLFRLL